MKADNVTPIKPNPKGDEVKRLTLHDSDGEICNSKTIHSETCPGVKMFHMEQSFFVHIEAKGKVVRMPITNIKGIYLK